MDRNQAWPGEPPSQLAATSTHELFGGSSGPGGQQQHPYGQQQQQQDANTSYNHQYASEVGAKKSAKRNRNALSCAECRRLKLKCSRIWPCTVSCTNCRDETNDYTERFQCYAAMQSCPCLILAELCQTVRYRSGVTALGEMRAEVPS